MKLLKLLSLSILTLSLLGCSNKNESLKSDKIDIVTSFYPIYSISQEITKNSDNINLLNMTTPSTGCLHDYQLTSGDMKKLAKADLFIINGGDMESFLPQIEKSLPDLKIVDTSTGTYMIDGHSHEEHDHSHEELDHSHDEHNHSYDEHDHSYDEHDHSYDEHDHSYDEHDHSYDEHDHSYDEHDHSYDEHDIIGHVHSDDDGHDHSSLNGHIWLSPENAVIQAENILTAVKDLDPENETLYEENFKNFKNSIENLISETENLNFEGKSTAVFHEGYSYFADQFGFDIKAEIYMDENTDPSPKLLAETIDSVKENNIQVLLCSDDASLKIAETVSEETGAKIYVLDPLTYGNNNGETYVDIMTRNANIIKEAFQ